MPNLLLESKPLPQTWNFNGGTREVTQILDDKYTNYTRRVQVLPNFEVPNSLLGVNFFYAPSLSLYCIWGIRVVIPARRCRYTNWANCTQVFAPTPECLTHLLGCYPFPGPLSWTGNSSGDSRKRLQISESGYTYSRNLKTILPHYGVPNSLRRSTIFPTPALL